VSLDAEDEQDEFWQAVFSFEAIDKHRSLKIVPFLYLRKDKDMKAHPFQISIERDEQSANVQAVKVLQKSRELDENTFQVFEFAKVRGEREDTSCLSLFALNTEDLAEFEDHEVDKLLQTHVASFLTESIANEMDPNIILLRLNSLTPNSEDSKSISSVSDGEKFMVSFTKKTFNRKREATNLRQIQEESLQTFEEKVRVKDEQFRQEISEKFGVTNQNDTSFNFTTETVSNLLGSIGHYNGPLKRWMKSMGHTFVKTDDFMIDLLTACPSRARYARGFSWDEGFHLLPICKWDFNLCSEIFRSWFYTMESDGWLPNE